MSVFIFFHLLAGERELRARIKDLMRYRKNGITKLAGNLMLRKVTQQFTLNQRLLPYSLALVKGELNSVTRAWDKEQI